MDGNFVQLLANATKSILDNVERSGLIETRWQLQWKTLL